MATDKIASSPTPSKVSASEVMHIDISDVLRRRVPSLWPFIPKALVGWLARTVHQDELNALLEETRGLQGADFCRGVLKSLNVEVDVKPVETLPDPSNRRVIFVCNHPLGGLDGMALIDWVQAHYGGQVWFVVNDLLNAVEPLQPVFLAVNKFGRQQRESVRRIDSVMGGNDPVIIFPAGLVSRLQKTSKTAPNLSGWRVHDLPWKKMFVQKAREFHRDVIPLHFSGENSMDFYRKARRRQRLGLKFNIEMIFLPREVFLRRNSRFTVSVGQTIPWQQFAEGDPQNHANRLASLIYELPSKLQK